MVHILVYDRSLKRTLSSSRFGSQLALTILIILLCSGLAAAGEVQRARAATVSLGEALDNTSLTWSSGGNVAWYGQTTTSYYGGDAAQSGAITHSQTSWLSTTVSGMRYLRFRWRVSSESGYDYLSLYMDYELMERISGETGWQVKAYYVPTGSHTFEWRYTKDGSVSSGSDCGWVDQVELVNNVGMPIGEAVDNTALTWQSSAANAWFGENMIYTYGGDAAQSGYIYNNGNTYIETSVTGPGTLTFYWKVSSESGDALVFYIDGSSQGGISGNVDWQYRSFTITGGLHVLRWTYSKDASLTDGQDAGWVDKVEFTSAGGYSATIWSWCAIEGWLSRPITKDGVSTGYSTPHTFAGLTGTHTFTVPSTDALGHTFYEWSTGSTSRTITVSSAGTYTARYKLGTTALTVISPNGGQTWIRGTTHTITWSSTGSPGANVKIELLKGGAVNRVITSSTANDGSYSWTISSTQTLGTDYMVRITSTTNPAVSDSSNSNFAVVAGTLTVTTPNGGNSWKRGTVHTITWTKSGSPGSYVKIELLKGGVVNKVLTSSTANDGSYGWTISSTQTAGTDYKIRITSTTYSSISDSSNSNFAITT